MDTNQKKLQNRTQFGLPTLGVRSFKERTKVVILDILFAAYRFLVKPALLVLSGYSHKGCKFHPTCSHYSHQAFLKFNFFKASRLSVLRLLKCNPWSKSFGQDPLPPTSKVNV